MIENDDDRRIWQFTEPIPRTWDSKAAWERLASRLDDRPRRSIDVMTQRSMHRRWTLFLAAALVFLFAGTAVVYRVVGNRAAATRLAAKKTVPMNEVVTRRGQRAMIQLADGTKITLNVDSRLRYPQTYGLSDRTLHLEGEAYFEVAHDSIPFIVKTTQSTVRDLGTRFVVTAYANHSETQVVVADGAVLLYPSAQTDSLTLTASMLGTVSGTGLLSAVSGVDVADHLAWIEGRLVFVGTPLSEVVQRLSRWYDADVRLADLALGRIRFSGSFHSENRESVLRLLAASAGTRLERSGAAFVLSQQ